MSEAKGESTPSQTEAQGGVPDAEKFNALYDALVGVSADVLPVDTTHLISTAEDNRTTLMARTTADGRKYISEKFLTLGRRSRDPRTLRIDVLRTYLFLDDDDRLTVTIRQLDQDVDEAGVPIPGQFSGPAEPEVVQGERREQDITRIEEAVGGLITGQIINLGS